MWSPRQVTHLPPVWGLLHLFYFPWHRHQIEGTNGFYCLIRKTERFTISNVESQGFTPNNSRLPRGLNAGGPRPKRVSYHWTTAPLVRTHTSYQTPSIVVWYLSGRLSDSPPKEPGFESPRLQLQNLRIFVLFTMPQFIQLYKWVPGYWCWWKYMSD